MVLYFLILYLIRIGVVNLVIESLNLDASYQPMCACTGIMHRFFKEIVLDILEINVPKLAVIIECP